MGRGGPRAPEQLRAPPRGLLPAAAAPRLLPRCAAPGAVAESPPQLQGRPGRVTPLPPRAPLPELAGRMEPREGASQGGECNPSPQEPPSCDFPAETRSPFLWTSRPLICRARGPRRRSPQFRDPPAPDRSGGIPVRRAGRCRPGAPPGNCPGAGPGALGPRPRPLVLRAPGPGPSAWRAPEWAAQSFVLSPLQAQAGIRGMGRAGARVWDPGQRGVRGDAALPAARVLCSAQPSLPGGRAGRPRPGSRRAPG